MNTLSPRLVRMLDERVARAQREYRSPGLAVGIVRDGQPVWSSYVGASKLDTATARATQPISDDSRFMIGSITKTFTAVLVMMLRDEGKISLDDTLGRWLPGSKHAAITVRSMLCHSSGLQREPEGHLWESLEAPDRETLVAHLEDAEQVLPMHHAFHYSNLAYTMLGEIVVREFGRPWEDVVRERIFEPLGMTRTTLTPGDDRAFGYGINPYSGVAAEEPLFTLNATAPLGGIWATVPDMLRWAAFVADPAASGILAESTIEEMCRPLIMTDTDSWGGAYGLGFGMMRRGDRVFVGHGGAMPGYLSGLRVRRPEKLGCFAVANCSAGASTPALAAELLDMVLDEEPTFARLWTPEAPTPALDDILGVWFSEGSDLTFFVEDGQLHSRLGHDDSALSRSRYVQEAPDVYRIVEGHERGEKLEVVRNADGSVQKMYLATYAVTRDPRSFADLAAGRV